MKNLHKILLLIIISTSLYSTTISKKDCIKKGENFIYAHDECIEFYESEGDIENEINIIVHGTWKKGTNTLARYAPFADNISMNTDITTIAIALPGYSNSSSNNLQALAHKGKKPLAATKKYIDFLAKLVLELKTKYNAKIVNILGHSAGAMMSATLSAYKPNLINNVILAGGIYDIHKRSKEKGLISIVDFINNIDKNTKYLVIYGTKDTVSKPKITKDFYKLAKSKNINIKILEVKNAPHIDLDMTDESIEAIT